MLVGADDGAVDEMQAPVDPALAISTSLKRLQDTLPNAGFAPAVEAARYRADRAIALRKVLPGRSGAVNPENTIDDRAVVVVRPPSGLSGGNSGFSRSHCASVKS